MTENAAKDLIARFKDRKSTRLDVVINSEKFDLNLFLQGLWEDSLQEVTISNATFRNEFMNQKIAFCVLIFDNEEKFLEKFKSFNFDIFDVHGHYLIVLTDQLRINQNLTFMTMWKKSFYNINVLISNDGKSVDLFTFYPFTENDCQSSESILINQFVDTWRHQEFFPPKLNNFHKCPIKVGAVENVSSFHRVVHRNGSADYIGKGVELMKELVHALNFEPKIDFSAKFGDWGDVLMNGSSYGIISQLITGDSDMIMDFIINMKRAKFVDFSDTYFFCPLIVIVPAGAPFTSFENLFRPYSTSVWVVTVITISSASLAIFIFKLQKLKVRNLVFENDIHNAYYNLLVIIVGGSIVKVPRKNFTRILFMAFVIFSIVMRTVFQSNMFYFLQASDHKKMVKTFEDMEERGFDLYLKADIPFSNMLKYPAK